MPRAERQVPNVYFGRPGALVTLPWPRGDMDKPFERQTFDFLTGSGNHAVSSLTTGSRSYTVKWDALHADTFARIEQYRTGMNGAGPWALIDPSAPNLLPANVAAATGLYNNVTHFGSSLGAHGTPSSQSAAGFIHRPGGSRSLRWLFPVTPATLAILTVQALYRNWWAQPVVPGLSYVFSSWIRTDGVIDTSAGVAMKLDWLDSGGFSTGSVATTGVVTVTGWQRLSVIATAPAGVAYVRPSWELTGSTMTVGGSLYIDEPLLEQDSVLNDWAPGTGIRPVEIVGLGEVVPFAARFRTGTALTLREVAR